MTFHLEYTDTDTLLFKYAADKRSVDLDTMLSELAVDPLCKTGLLLSNSRLIYRAEVEWARRLKYWSRRHRREYRMRYDSANHRTVVACTNPVWRSVSEQKQQEREAVREQISYVVRLGGL